MECRALPCHARSALSAAQRAYLRRWVRLRSVTQSASRATCGSLRSAANRCRSLPTDQPQVSVLSSSNDDDRASDPLTGPFVTAHGTRRAESAARTTTFWDILVCRRALA